MLIYIYNYDIICCIYISIFKNLIRTFITSRFSLSFSPSFCYFVPTNFRFAKFAYYCNKFSISRNVFMRFVQLLDTLECRFTTHYVFCCRIRTHCPKHNDRPGVNNNLRNFRHSNVPNNTGGLRKIVYEGNQISLGLRQEALLHRQLSQSS